MQGSAAIKTRSFALVGEAEASPRLASPRRHGVAIRFPSGGTMRGRLMVIPFFASRTLLLLWQRLQKIAQIPERKC